MKTSVAAMKKEMKTVNLDEVENVQDDMEDMLEEANDIQVGILLVQPASCHALTGNALALVRRVPRH